MEDPPPRRFIITIVFNKWFGHEWSVDAKIREWTVIGAQNILQV